MEEVTVKSNSNTIPEKLKDDIKTVDSVSKTSSLLITVDDMQKECTSKPEIMTSNKWTFYAWASKDLNIPSILAVDLDKDGSIDSISITQILGTLDEKRSLDRPERGDAFGNCFYRLLKLSTVNKINDTEFGTWLNENIKIHKQPSSKSWAGVPCRLSATIKDGELTVNANMGGIKLIEQVMKEVLEEMERRKLNKDIDE